jgi:MerR family transcriptional regulator, thiopeptide resistance regulator
MGRWRVTPGPFPRHSGIMTTTNGTGVRSAVIPVLVYADIEAAHDFLVDVFGFTSGGLHRLDDGTVVHAEVRNGDAAIWLHQETAEHELASPRDAVLSHGGLSVIVPDVDAHYARAQAAGARLDSVPTEQPYGLREYGARDPENHRWWFSSPLS